MSALLVARRRPRRSASRWSASSAPCASTTTPCARSPASACSSSATPSCRCYDAAAVFGHAGAPTTASSPSSCRARSAAIALAVSDAHRPARARHPPAARRPRRAGARLRRRRALRRRDRPARRLRRPHDRHPRRRRSARRLKGTGPAHGQRPLHRPAARRPARAREHRLRHRRHGALARCSAARSSSPCPARRALELAEAVEAAGAPEDLRVGRGRAGLRPGRRDGAARHPRRRRAHALRACSASRLDTDDRPLGAGRDRQHHGQLLRRRARPR